MHLDMPWMVSFTLQDFLHWVIINIIITTLLRFFDLQRAQCALLLSFTRLYPGLRRVSIVIVECDSERRVLLRGEELSVEFPKFYPLQKLSWIFGFSSIQQSELLISDSQRLEGISKHFGSDSLRELMFYQHRRAKLKEFKVRAAYWTSSGWGILGSWAEIPFFWLVAVAAQFCWSLVPLG